MWKSILASLLFAAAILSAQSVTGTITGTVKDSTNLPVAGASVSLVQTATGSERQTPTDVRGDFVFSSVAPGEYRFSARQLDSLLIRGRTPTRYPATLRAVQIYFPSAGLPMGTAISVLSAPHPSGSGASPLTGVALQSTAATITARAQFVEYAAPLRRSIRPRSTAHRRRASARTWARARRASGSSLKPMREIWESALASTEWSWNDSKGASRCVERDF